MGSHPGEIEFCLSKRGVQVNEVPLLVSDLSCFPDSTEGNWPFLRCLEPHYESDTKCKAFHVKISFVCIRMKTDFHNKNYARGLAFRTSSK